MDAELILRRFDALDARLARIDERLEPLDVVAAQAARAEELAREHGRTLRGVDDKNGIVSRVRVLEEDRETQRWWMRSVVAGVLSAIGGTVWALLRGGSGSS